MEITPLAAIVVAYLFVGAFFAGQTYAMDRLLTPWLPLWEVWADAALWGIGWLPGKIILDQRTRNKLRQLAQEARQYKKIQTLAGVDVNDREAVEAVLHRAVENATRERWKKRGGK